MNININTGEIRLTVNDDPNRVITFNPNDITFAERFYDIIRDFEAKEKVYKARSHELDQNKEMGPYDIPRNTGEGLKLLREICEDMREQIDRIFGEGTSTTAFGNAVALDMFAQFFDGITPYIKKAREARISKYTAKAPKKNVM